MIAGFYKKTSPGKVNVIDHPRVFGFAKCPGKVRFLAPPNAPVRVVNFINGPGAPFENS
jgi:hypothetical protein